MCIRDSVDPDAFHLICTDVLEAVTAQGVEQLGVPDRFTDAEAEFVARHLGFYRRPDGAVEAGGDFLSMLGVPDVDALDAHTMWPGVRNKLTVPIGATPDGQPVYLDLKEAALGGMGPHGLCIGATGSGNPERGFGVRCTHGNNRSAASSDLRTYFAR